MAMLRFTLKQKPLRYDAKADCVFPDFVLLDMVASPYAMEVYGRFDERSRTLSARPNRSLKLVPSPQTR
jgi:hypothetical protein